MKNSKIIKLLKTFSKEELREFDKFISSPFFARGRNVKPFFKVLRQYHPSFENETFTAENVYGKLFPGKTFSKNSIDVLKTLSYELNRMCEEYFIQTGIRENKSLRNYYLLKKLREKKLYQMFEKQYIQETTRQRENFGGSVYDLVNRFFLLETNNEYSVETRKYKEAIKTMASMDETLLAAGLIRAYRGIEYKHLAVTGFNMESPANFSDVFLECFDSKNFLLKLKNKSNCLYPYILISHLFYLISEYPDNFEYYTQFKKVVKENLDKLGHIEKYILLSRMLSYCVEQFDKTNENRILNEEFEIYNIMFSMRLYKWSEKDNISIHLFRNVVITSFILKKYAWLEKFVRNYAPEVDKKDRNNIKNYAYAHINFGRKNYRNALQNIAGIEINLEEYKIDLKLLMFKIYYEMGLLEKAFDVVESMRQYKLRSAGLKSSKKSDIMKIVKFGKELLKHKTSSQKMPDDFLLQQLKKEKLLWSGTWFVEKFEELSK